ncbi:Protein Brevis radix-like 2 [Hibiscus syriacus]|uniref:Protein Brevis radix-like 2 n=1 Tax=Hibiscus syriacus TaxID=106335 RepID=A0A6A2YU65_HIBSY|nr:Protein Brevis radix-like 2 [Hibiscus syriacus]
MESAEESPVTPPLTKERLPRNLHHPTGMGMAYSSSDSLDQHPMQSRHYCDSGLTSTPKLSSISGAKTEISSMDASMRSSSSREADRSRELSISNASDLETEWVEMDEPGVYITIRALPGGKRELRRVRFRYGSRTFFNISNTGKGLERCMPDCGGKRTEPGYTNNTCNRAKRRRLTACWHSLVPYSWNLFCKVVKQVFLPPVAKVFVFPAS